MGSIWKSSAALGNMHLDITRAFESLGFSYLASSHVHIPGQSNHWKKSTSKYYMASKTNYSQCSNSVNGQA